jgi:two-component system, cell cycle response regulator DivK
MIRRSSLVLVVDDNPLNLELVTDVLEAAGHVVRQASSGAEVLATVRQDTPDLILMDIGLPGMDGYAILRALRGDPLTASIPVVALTAYAMDGDEQQVQEAGFDGYITKPINTRSFPHTVAGMLQQRVREHE